MILLKDAIDSGAWLEILYKYPGSFLAGPAEMTFRIKVKSFVKINLNELGENEYQSTFYDEIKAKFLSKIGFEANVWKIDLDLVNMEKTENSSLFIKQGISLGDSEGYKFPVCTDTYIEQSPYGNKSGIKHFSDINFPPKIKKSGSYCFELPEFFDDLYISSTAGSIKEV